MGNSKSNYQLLIEKLDRFTRKYYTNQALRGTLFWIGLMLVIFLCYSLLEHTFYFEKGVRKFLFFSFIGIGGLTLMYWVLTPLMHYLKLGKLISHEQAAQIIGSHFQDVKDKLLNILQLKRQADQTQNPDLIFAGINQKTEEIKLVPFRKAIDLSKNRRHLRYALPPLLILLAFLVAAPTVIKESTHRIIKNNEDFEREAPFHFAIDQGADLQVVQYSDFLLNVGVDGSALPNEVFIDVDGNRYRMKKQSNSDFSYRFKNVHKDTEFRVYAATVSSEDYTLKVLKKPNLVSFDIRLDYPGYTGRKDETLTGIGDLVLPVGTRVTWDFNTLHADAIDVRFSSKNERIGADRNGDDLFSLRKRVSRDEIYTLYMSNDYLPNSDSINYAINVIPDLYPTISVEKFEDSTDHELLFFVGNAGDDYGIKSLTFHYEVKENDGKQNRAQSFPLSLKSKKQFQYDYTFDIAELELKPGQELTYYFEVFDNDAVNGSKSSRTSIMEYRMPTAEEFEAQEDQNNDDIKDSLEESLKESKKIQEELKRMREKLFQEKDLEWQSKKELENLMERQKELQQKMQNAQNLFEENLQNQEEFTEPTEEMMEKQERLQELFEELMTDEMKEMMEEFNDLLDQLEKEDALEMLEEMEFSDEELEKELDRLLELFKQMEMEQELQEKVDELNQLAEEEEKLSEETAEQEKSNEQLNQEQEELNEKFDELQKEMEELQDKNEELERPKNLGDSEEQMEKIEQDMENSQQQLQQNQNQKASESQKSASERMREMAQSLQSQMAEGQQEQMQEDMATLRQLLENLVTLSFDQEDLIDGFEVTNITTPRYVGLVQDQFKIKDDFKVVEDSLQALSKRVFQIESFVTEKVTEVKENLHKGIKQLEERKKAAAANHQQRVMTSLNDLALMLSEVLNQMQQQMSSMMPGNQMCNNPGGQGQGKSGNVPSDKITEGQKSLNDEMKKMMQQMKNGQKGSSEQFARMAARQSALRKALRDLQKQKQERGQGDKALEDIMQNMDKIETELVNKKLTNEMLKRQNEILTRLLESERAEREREYDNKRQAEAGRELERKMPPSLEEYIKKREAEIEEFNAVSPSLKPYYKFLVEEYYNALKGE